MRRWSVTDWMSTSITLLDVIPIVVVRALHWESFTRGERTNGGKILENQRLFITRDLYAVNGSSDVDCRTAIAFICYKNDWKSIMRLQYRAFEPLRTPNKNNNILEVATISFDTDETGHAYSLRTIARDILNWYNLGFAKTINTNPFTGDKCVLLARFFTDAAYYYNNARHNDHLLK